MCKSLFLARRKKSPPSLRGGGGTLSGEKGSSSIVRAAPKKRRGDVRRPCFVGKSEAESAFHSHHAPARGTEMGENGIRTYVYYYDVQDVPLLLLHFCACARPETFTGN